MPRINELFAFIADKEGPDDEGILVAMVGDEPIALVATTLDEMPRSREWIYKVAQQNAFRVQLVKFSHREVLETLNLRENGHHE